MPYARSRYRSKYSSRGRKSYGKSRVRSYRKKYSSYRKKSYGKGRDMQIRTAAQLINSLKAKISGGQLVNGNGHGNNH